MYADDTAVYSKTCTSVVKTKCHPRERLYDRALKVLDKNKDIITAKF